MRRGHVVGWALVCWAAAFAAPGQGGDLGALRHVESVVRDDLQSCNCVIVSDDGKFVYAAAWEAMTLHVFARDEPTGKLTHVQQIRSDRDLNGVTAIVLSPDGTRAAASAFRSQAVSLFARDPESGKLRLLDVQRQDENAVRGLVWAIDLAFSHDGKFVYVLDPYGPGVDANNRRQGAITAFERTENDKLRWVETFQGPEGILADVRGIAIHPDDERIFVGSSTGAALVMMRRDQKTGKVTVAQIIRDGEGEATCLNGAFTPVVAPDERFLILCSGRFHGDSAVSVFRLNDEGQMEFVQELSADTGDIPNFLGGNVLAIAPDGRSVYAAGTRGGSLACFFRDLETGKLTWIETLVDDTGKGELGGAAGVAVSPDGRHVYVAAEFDSAVSVYERMTGEQQEEGRKREEAP